MQKITVRENSMANIKAGVILNRDLLIAVMCFFISRAMVFSVITPMGVAFYAASYRRGVWGYLNLFASILGVLSVGGGVEQILALVFFTVTAKLDEKWVFKNTVFTSIFAFGSVFLSSIYFVIKKGGFIYDFLLLMLYATATFIGVYAFSVCLPVVKGRGRRYLEHEEVISLTVLFSVFTLGIPAFTVFSMSFQNIVCILLILFFSLSKKVGVVTICGIIAGLILGIGRANLFAYVGTLSFCALLAGLAGKTGKIGICVSFFIGSMVSSVYAPTVAAVDINIYEMLAAFLIFILTPKKAAALLGLIKTEVKRAESETRLRETIFSRLHNISSAFSQLSSSITNLTSDSVALTDYSVLFDKVADNVCKNCKLANVCWQKNFNYMYDCFLHCFKQLEQNNSLTASDAPEHFKGRCINLDGLMTEMNRTFGEYQNEIAWAGKLERSNSIITRQLSDVSAVIEGLADDLHDNVTFNEDIAFEIACALDKRGAAVKNISVYKNPYGRFEVKMEVATCHSEGFCETYERIISEILERKMQKTAGECMLSRCGVTFCEAPDFKISSASAHKAKSSEQPSGDNSCMLTLPNGSFIMVLSDGMGSGEAASVQSRETINLITRLMYAGFEPASTISLVNKVLSQNKNEEIFSTVDMTVINPATGNTDFIKNGACTTYIKRENTVRRVLSHSLPAGILEEVDTEHKKEVLIKDDLLIMMSDGIGESFEDENELLGIINTYDCFEPQVIADKLISEAARARGGREGDDMTVLVAKII